MNHINPAHCTEALVELMLGEFLPHLSRKTETTHGLKQSGELKVQNKGSD
jgi:hypothetical protein